MEYPHLTSITDWMCVCGHSCHGDSGVDGETAGSWKAVETDMRVSAGLSGSMVLWCCGGSGSGGGGGGGGNSWAGGAATITSKELI